MLILSLDSHMTLAGTVSPNLSLSLQIKKPDWKVSKVLLSVYVHVLRSQVAYQHIVKSIHILLIISATRFDT